MSTDRPSRSASGAPSAPCNTTRDIRIDFHEIEDLEVDEYVVKYRISGSIDEYSEFIVPGSGHLVSGIPNCYDLDFLIQSYCKGDLVGNNQIFTLYALDPNQYNDEIVNVPFTITPTLVGFKGQSLRFQLSPHDVSTFKYNKTKGTYHIDINWIWIQQFLTGLYLMVINYWPPEQIFGSPSGQITDSKLYPKSNINLYGVSWNIPDYGPMSYSGHIDTDGRIWLKAHPLAMASQKYGKDIHDINLKYTADAGDFNQGATPPTTTRPPRTTRPSNLGTNNVTR